MNDTFPQKKRKPNYNAIQKLEGLEDYEAIQREATDVATDIIASTPFGSVYAAKALGKTIKNHRLLGTMIAVGIPASVAILWGFSWSALVAHFAPAEIASDAKIEHRLGNQVGRLTNATWNGIKQPLGATFVHYYQTQNGVSGSATQQPQQSQSSGIPGVIEVGNFSSTTTPTQTQTSLSEEQQKAIESFLK